MEEIVERLNGVLQRIERACRQSNRDPETVRLLMATKTVDPDRIKIALQSGQRLIGENKIQEVKEKYDALKAVPHESHFIGHLQTNKIKDLLKYGVDCVQSVDRLKLAEKLQQRLTFEEKELDVLLQVNTSGEESKFGVSPEGALELAQKVAGMDRLHIKGLMTIGLFSEDKQKVRLCFQKLKAIRRQLIELNLPGVEMSELSMGMSGDLEIAIDEGATIVRVGTAIFGKRQYPDSYYWKENKK